jgi:hypothetical protein
MKKVAVFSMLAGLFLLVSLYCAAGLIQAGSFDGVGGYTHERAMFNADYWGFRALGSLFVALAFACGAIFSWLRHRRSRRSSS